MEGRSAPAVTRGARRRRDEVVEGGERPTDDWAKRRREAEGSGGGGDGVLSEERRTRARVQLTPAVAALPPPSTALQRLVHACRTVFRGSETVPPTPAAVSLIRGLLDEMGPDDVGLRTEVRFFNKTNAAGRQNPPIITCKNLHECDHFTIAVFFMPKGTVMPLHDHPGMTVFSKLLLGSAHVTSYDWIRPSIRAAAAAAGSSPVDNDHRATLAKKVLDHDLTAASGTTWVLYPNAGGNMHRFAAGEDSPCALLDVLAPPYSPAQRRVCNFYQDFPYDLHHPDVVGGGVDLTEEQKRRLAWLRQIDTPRDLRIHTLPFPGGPAATGDLLDDDTSYSAAAAAQGRSPDNS